MKIKITKQQAEEISELRNSLARAGTKLAGSVRGYEKLERRKEELTREVANLESGDPGDKRVRTALRDAKDELELTEQKLKVLNQQHGTTGSPEHSSATSIVHNARIAIGRALTPAMESRLAEAIKVVRPLFTDDAHAVHAVAAQSPFYVQFCHYCTRPYITFLNISPETVGQITALCDEVLSGELKFEFNPNTK